MILQICSFKKKLFGSFLLRKNKTMLSAWREYLAFRCITWVLFWLFWYFQAMSELNLYQLKQQEEVEGKVW